MFSDLRKSHEAGGSGFTAKEITILKELMRYVESFEAQEFQHKVPTKQILKFAEQLGVDLGDIPKNVNSLKFAEYVYQIASQKGLSAGFVTCINIIQDRHQVFTAEVLRDTTKTFNYLSDPLVFSEVKLVAERNYIQTIGFSMNNFAFVDPVKARKDANLFLEHLNIIVLSNQYPLFTKLSSFIRTHKVDQARYSDVCSYNRIKFEEIQHAKDHIFADLMTEDQSMSKAHRVKYLLKPESIFYKLLDSAKTEIERQLIGSAVVEYSGSLLGILTELTIHKHNHDYVNGSLAFLDFLSHQLLRRESEKNPAGNGSYNKASMMFFDKLCRVISLDLNEYSLATLFDRKPEEVVNIGINYLTKMVAIDFYDDSERAALVENRRKIQ